MSVTQHLNSVFGAVFAGRVCAGGICIRDGGGELDCCWYERLLDIPGEK